MKQNRENDEYMERLWYMQEEGQDSIDVLREAMDDKFNMYIISGLVSEGLITLTDSDKKITFTTDGEKYARQLIRSHRLAERMVHDVMGRDFEAGACEFEHIITPELVDSICTLLGHPKECPHGLPIPEGECCKRADITTHSLVIPMTELKVGQSARVAYINCREDRRLHKIDGLHIRPGSIVKLHQTYPSYVIECENANIAMDKELVDTICVWRDLADFPGREKERKKDAPGRVRRRPLKLRLRQRGD